ncbi:MAG: hypothetical protein ACFFCI_09775, partial [Promethearchaeota archaeon]
MSISLGMLKCVRCGSTELARYAYRAKFDAGSTSNVIRTRYENFPVCNDCRNKFIASDRLSRFFGCSLLCGIPFSVIGLVMTPNSGFNSTFLGISLSILIIGIILLISSVKSFKKIKSMDKIGNYVSLIGSKFYIKSLNESKWISYEDWIR